MKKLIIIIYILAISSAVFGQPKGNMVSDCDKSSLYPCKGEKVILALKGSANFKNDEIRSGKGGTVVGVNQEAALVGFKYKNDGSIGLYPLDSIYVTRGCTKGICVGDTGASSWSDMIIRIAGVSLFYKDLVAIQLSDNSLAIVSLNNVAVTNPCDDYDTKARQASQ